MLGSSIMTTAKRTLGMRTNLQPTDIELIKEILLGIGEPLDRFEVAYALDAEEEGQIRPAHFAIREKQGQSRDPKNARFVYLIKKPRELPVVEGCLVWGEWRVFS